MNSTDHEMELPIPQRFERIVQKYPQRTAIKAKNRIVSYDALNKAANRIGRGILDVLGPGNEPVGLLLGNGFEAVAALLGVLKAGKCYVAIDPYFPLPRIEYMLRDTEARLLVTDNKNWEIFDRVAGQNCTGFNIDHMGDRIPDENLGLTIPLNSNLNILYTSGSTAEPKGVVRTHEYIIEQSSNHIEYASVRPDDRLSLLHSICFGSAEANLYRSLLSGASLFPFDVKGEGVSQLVPWLIAEKITILHCSPSLFRQFVDCLPADVGFPRLRLVHLSGSPIAESDFDQYKKHFPPSTSLAFHMGATEAPCIASAVVDHNFSFPGRGTPTGYTCGQKKVLLLDEDGREVGVGAIGEIAVKSRYLAKEYWHHPELTKAKFLPVPDSPGERIYLTGDLGQFQPDGFLVHLGRKDFMVKIRGYRVELGEVERALLTHPEVKEAAVVAWGREAGEAFLAAYLVPRGKQVLAVDQVLAFLRKKLPDYMIPFRFSFLDSLPLINGKLNKRALPKPERIRPQMSRAYEPPESELQRSLAAIWTQVLGIDNVGIRDSFFDLGGNSLLASLVLSRLRDQWQAEISMPMLFAQPTIADLAALIAGMKVGHAKKGEVADLLAEIESLTDEQATHDLADRAKSGTSSA